jgi:hypothetical protein
VEDGRESSSVTAIYQTRLAARRDAAARLDRRHATLAWTRLAIFFSGAAVLVALGSAGAPWLALPIAAFVPLLFVHAHVLNARDRANRAAAFYERGLARIEDRWQGTGELGERFRDASHLYAEDLDLFGAGGLFELLATARTRDGERLLADWLLAPANAEVIAERQDAVRDLRPRIDLREELSVVGPEIDAAVRTDDLTAWALASPQLTASWPRFVLPVIAGFSTAALVAWIAQGEPPWWLLPALAVQLSVAGLYRHRVHHVAHGVEQREQELRVLATLMERIEREPVESARLRHLREQLRATGRSPADEIRRLARLVEILSSGHNQIFGPISALLLLGTQLAFAVERWRVRCGPAVPQWLAAVAEYEALTSLATYAAEHPADPFPEIAAGPSALEAEALAHPLLPIATAVPNDVRLGGAAPQLLLVSGSNMSGKSTLLRTVGLNAVLAQAGAPIRGRRLRLTPLRVGGTLRIQDSLQAGRSRFFAEITRISAIVALARETPVLFLLDEILSGTNSHDRLQGASGILTGLIDLGAIGLATTHDLALTAMVDGIGARAANVHFEDRFDTGVLTFDYRLRPGVVQSSNAIALMRAVGLEV